MLQLHAFYIFEVSFRLYISYLYINIRSPGQSYRGHWKLITMINMSCMLTLSVCAAETCLSVIWSFWSRLFTCWPEFGSFCDGQTPPDMFICHLCSWLFLPPWCLVLTGRAGRDVCCSSAGRPLWRIPGLHPFTWNARHKTNMCTDWNNQLFHVLYVNSYRA